MKRIWGSSENELGNDLLAKRAPNLYYLPTDKRWVKGGIDYVSTQSLVNAGRRVRRENRIFN